MIRRESISDQKRHQCFAVMWDTGALLFVSTHMSEFFFFTYKSILKKLGKEKEYMETGQKYMELRFDMQRHVETESEVKKIFLN